MKADYSAPKGKHIIFALLLISLSAILISPALAQLSGTYSIGLTGNYASFTTAVDALEAQGVSGPVIFNVQDGIYDEQIEINAITGVSENNQIVFQSASGDSSKVILRHRAAGDADNFVIKLAGGSHIIFKQISLKTGKGMYGKAVVLENFSSQIRFLNCMLTGIYHNDASARYHLVSINVPHIHYLSFEYCFFDSAGTGININTGTQDYPMLGVYVGNNHFTNMGYSSMYFNITNAPEIRNNYIQAASMGIRLTQTSGQTVIDKNHIISGHTGMDLTLNGYAGYPAAVTNNFISSAESEGFELRGQYVDVYHNSIRSGSSGETTNALYIYGTANTHGINILNNNICRMVSGRALYVYSGSAMGECSHNNFYTAGNSLAFWDSVECYNLTELQLKSAKNENSLSVFPHFLSASDLHTIAPWLDGKGTPLTEITEDMDGDPRNASHPDIGADEFTTDPATTTPLAGSYNVGSGVYPSVQSAIDDAVLKGISESVMFNILPGHYNEQVVIHSIPGTSPVNRVKLRSSTGDTADVRIFFNSTSQNANYTIQSYGADFISYENLTIQAANATYGHVLDLYEGSDSIVVNGCHLIGTYNTNALATLALIHSADSYYRQRTIQNNTFENGAYAIYMRRDNWQWEHPINTEILNNRILNTGYSAIYLQFYDGLVINENTIEGGSYGIYCISSDNASEILKNRIRLNRGSGGGIVLSNCAATDLNRGIIANNFISGISSSGLSGIKITSGIHYDVCYNTVSISSANSESIALELASGSSQYINIINNNFSCLDNGYAFSVANASFITAFDYNNLYSPANFLGQYNGSTFFDLDLVKKYSGTNTHSLSVYPHYLSDDNLHTIAPWLDNRGTPLAGITLDIDGEVRDVLRPDIGADEFTANPAFTIPLTGNLTIGTGGDYPTIQQAFDDAVLKGVSGAVNFNLLPGVYTEQVVISSVPGANPKNPLTLRPQSGDTSDTEIRFSATQSDANYVIRFNGADFIRLENLKISATGPTYARVFDFYLGADSISIEKNVLSSQYNTNNNTIKAILFGDDSYYFSRIIEDNIFKNCSHAIYMTRPSSYVPSPLGAEILNNRMSNCGYTGIYLQFHDAPRIAENQISAGANGIRTISCKNELKILKNKISVTNGDGLYVGTSDAGLYHHGLIANNFIHVGGTGTAYGLHVVSSNYQDIVFNSVNVTSTGTVYNQSFNVNSGGNLLVKNNIFANSGGGYAYYNQSGNPISESDYNDLYTTGTNLAYWGGNRTNLAALQSAGGMEAHSVSLDPQYVSQTDLHTLNAGLDGKGNPASLVTDDIDGQNRHPVTPDIGADEFRTGSNTAPFVAQPINNQVFDEDTGPHVIADLRSVFSDPDSDDWLTLSLLDFPGVNAFLMHDTLLLRLDPNYFGTGTISVTATDLGGLSVTDSFMVTINSIPDPPVAVNDNATTLTNTLVEIYALENDWDVDSDLLTITGISDPPHGTAAILADGDTVITYNPDANFFGRDTIRYIIQDESALKDTAYVFIEVRNLFSESEATFPGVSNGTAIWVDIDLDNRLDLFLMGATDNSNNGITRIYKNKNTSFSTYLSLHGQIPDNPQGAAFGDFNNDGYPDVVITGKVTGDPFTIRTRIYKNMSGISFQEMTTGVINIWGGSVSWVDYDLDGDQDLLVSGSRTSDLYDEVTKLYRNDGASGTTGWNFVEVAMPALPQLSRTTVNWIDFDMDRDPDLLISGMTPDVVSKLLRNNQGQFEEVNVSLTAFGDGQWCWNDYDADGDPDLFFSGYTGGVFESAAGIYRNDGADGSGGWQFTFIETGIESLSFVSSSWLDFDNDGDFDLFLSGRNSMAGRRTVIYENNNGIFGTGTVTLPVVANGGCAWGDFDKDNRIDLLLTGMDSGGIRKTILMQNNLPAVNTPPEAPRIKGWGLNFGSITLIWRAATDQQTPSAALTYNLAVGTTENGVETVAPMADLENGFRHIVATGNVCGDTSWTISGVTEGKLYYFRVQAVDGALTGSSFSDVRSISMTSHYFYEVATTIPGLMEADAAFADYDRDGDHDLLTIGRSSDFEFYSQIHYYDPPTSKMRSAELVIPPAHRPSLDWRDFDSDLDPDLLLSGFDPEASLATYFTRIFNYQNNLFNSTETELPGSWEGDTRFIDFDNDGDLDVMILGHTWTVPFTYLMINENGQFYDSGFEFTGLYLGGQAWCDYDLDGDPDVVLTGISQTNHANTILYRNDGDTFTEMDAGLMQVCKGNPAWGDMDMDGDDDLVVTGETFNGESWTTAAKIYENEGGLLSEYLILPEGVKHGKIAWADIDNDGAPDIVMTGYIPSPIRGYQIPVNRVYLNNDGTFTNLDTYLGNFGDGTLAIGDLNGDHNLDLFFCGNNQDNVYESKVFRKISEPANTPPTPPSGLHAEKSDSSIVFTWNPGSDEQTSAAGLSYNIKVGVTPGGCELVNPQSDSTGFRLIPEAGNTGHLLQYRLKLRSIPDQIYWTVQSVDNSYTGSPFAAEQYINLTDIAENENFLPKEFALYQNYPNPFNPNTTVTFDLPKSGNVQLVLYNVLGQEVATLIDKPFAAARHKFVFDASGFAAGLYFYKIKAGQYHQVRKMLLIK